MNPRKTLTYILQFNWIRYLVFFGLILFFGLCGLDQEPFHNDESSRIYSSNTYEAFIHFDFKSPVWDESYWTLTQPPVSRYFIGFGRNLGGYKITNLKQAYDNFLTKEENYLLGAIPEENLLWWARFPMVFLMAFSFLILYYLVEKGFGLLTATIFFILLSFNSYLFYILRLALGEAPLLFFTSLVILFATWGSKIWINQKLIIKTRIIGILFFYLLMSVSIGFAAGSKLNGALALFGCIFLSIIIGKYTSNTKYKRFFVWIVPLIIGLISFVTFVLINPFLYANPFLRALEMLMFRNYEFTIQQTAFPEYQVVGIWNRFRIDVLNIFQTHTTINFQGAWMPNFSLFLLGIGMLLKNWKTIYANNPALWAILTISIPLCLPSLLTPLNYPRYFMFPVIFGLIFLSYGTSFIFLSIGKIISRRRNPAISLS